VDESILPDVYKAHELLSLVGAKRHQRRNHLLRAREDAVLTYKSAWSYSVGS
jgi:hypothetical protein